ncbi:hypothetical protein [Frigoriglobus tundricola]|uniref:Uncharacterized protein n=1 Tax=Frigoriglobus tundricola TaxID=2774151 RepID=A0A6M5Z080_9BACT|nr:hypothetical protein [Frigoriglobus tundricola]QJW98602.1 hypothetical protein FTUN_6197 [Frigoriglobus tundricola]
MGGSPVPELVLAIARHHIAGIPPVKGYRWRLAPGRRVSAGWYFDYEAERLPTNPPRPGSGFGYAPGFLVTDEESVRVVAWHELRAIHGLLPVGGQDAEPRAAPDRRT